LRSRIAWFDALCLPQRLDNSGKGQPCYPVDLRRGRVSAYAVDPLADDVHAGTCALDLRDITRDYRKVVLIEESGKAKRGLVENPVPAIASTVVGD